MTREELRQVGVYPIDADTLTRDMLDEALPECTIGTLSYPAGMVLHAVDLIAFGEEVNNYLDSLLTDGVIVEFDGEFYLKTELEEYTQLQDRI